MGGMGSGSHYHWWRSRKKTTVEECRRLDANRWTREGLLRQGIRIWGSWVWYTDASKKEQASSIDYEVNTIAEEPFVRLFYTFTGTQEKVGYRVFLTTTIPRFGGVRWWFLCPLSVNGRPCTRRVAKLYLPPGSHYFGCRHCYDLTYTSCQESHKSDSLYRFAAQLWGTDFQTAKQRLR